MFNKFKGLLSHDVVFQSSLVLLVGTVSFGLGRLSLTETPLVAGSSTQVLTAEPTVVSVQPSAIETEAYVTASTATTVQYVGSRNGTKFHLLTCPGASSIKEENKVYFSSKLEAYSRGYTEAANCKGI